MDTKTKTARPAILVVEDETLLRELATDCLMAAGFIVFAAANGDEALKLMETRAHVDILFTDIQMPGNLDGLALARAVHSRWPHVRLLLTSGRERPAKDAIPDAGRFIAKPFATAELMREIGYLV